MFWVALDRTLYSISVEERNTIDCSFFGHAMGAFSNLHMMPDVER